MTKKIRLSVIKAGMYVAKKMYKYGFISKGTAVKWMYDITMFFGKKEE